MNTTSAIPDNAVCAPNGKPIAFPKIMWGEMVRLVGLVRERFGREYKAEHGRGDGRVYLVPLEPMTERSFTVPERAAIEALAWYCGEYAGGLRRNVSVTLPKIIHDRIDAKVIDDEEPLSFGDEARAYMFAEVAEHAFPVSAQVIETPAGWAVTVSSQRNGLDAETLLQLQGACRVLLDYAVEAAGCAYASKSSAYMHHTPSPAARQAWHERQQAPLERIEARLEEILDRLERDAATCEEIAYAATDDGGLSDSIASGTELLANLEELAADKAGVHGAAKA